ncbi:MAG TPA: hypothetical protein DHW42_03580, partial [Candidatus Marinimicrobia bacterium]|nr:hypothetical protein [Candidatus Neomarinimicrobiota bacterium]
MENYFSTFAETSPVIIYFALFLFIFLENILPVVPGDAVLIFSAYLTGRGVLVPTMTFVLTVFGSIAGFTLAFALSRHWGRDFFEQRKFPFMSLRRMHKIDHYFHKFGDGFLMIGRLIPGVRLVLALIAGFSKISYLRAFSFTVVAILLWNGTIFILGRELGENWTAIKEWLSGYNTIVDYLLIFAVLCYVIYKIYKKTVERRHA